MKEKKEKRKILIFALFIFIISGPIQAQDVFTLEPGLEGEHPRILFTQQEADARAILVRKYMPEEWQLFVNDCKSSGYPNNASILGQQQWWYFSRLAIGIGLTKDQGMIDKGNVWLSTAFGEEWDFDAEMTVGLDIAHKLAGFALLYDCMYNYLTPKERENYEGLLKTGLVKFRTHGYDVGDYWTNDYQNNHMHFRATASIYCAAILCDKYPELQNEYNYIIKVWRYIGYMSPHDGSNHEGLNYVNYGGQMLYPGIMGLKHCTGINLTASEHYHNVGTYYMYHLVPGMTAGFGFGDSWNSASASGPNYLFQIASSTQDPYLQSMAHELRAKYPNDFFLRQWLILFNDPQLGMKEPADLPLYHHFDDLGIVVSRSSWDADATAVAFKCGPSGGIHLQETRGTEYSHFTDYINVAHDDPDAGTFLLFSKGSFLSTGDGYEKTDKITLQHSTFIVDDRTQYGGGGPWSQPTNYPDNYARQKDFFAVDDRVVFSGDMKGVYPGMEKLDRTFVSHKANYIIIYDDANSVSADRTFEWRLQTEGNLTSLDERTYRISNGNGSALARLLAPEAANWGTTTSPSTLINGNILRARLEGQQTNQYLVLLWPNASNLNAITENYNTPTAIGVKVTAGANNEYTLFQKNDHVAAMAGTIHFNANTLLLVENESGDNLVNVSVVNGDSLSYNGITLFSADKRINFGIESISDDLSGMACTIAPSSGSDTTGGVNISLGGLKSNTTYYAFREDEASRIDLLTDENGKGIVHLDKIASMKLVVNEKGINLTQLENTIKKAQDLHDAAREGIEPGEYESGSKSQFALEIDSAQNVLDTAAGQAEADEAVTNLREAIVAFINAVILDLSFLQDFIDQSNSLHDNAVEGAEEGEYETGSKAVFKSAITIAETRLADTTATQEDINKAVEDLVYAMAQFNLSMIPFSPLTVFSDVPYYGDFLNYTVNTKTLWEVIEEEGDVIVGMSSYSSTSGQYMLINDSIFHQFELTFDARSVEGTYANDIMIVFGYMDINNFSYAKLSSEVNKSGVFTRIGGPTRYEWLLEDYETYCVQDQEWTHYKMISLDSVITFYRDDEILFIVEPQQSLRYEGSIGVGTYYRNQAYFDDISVIELKSTGERKIEADKAFTIYPNPAHDLIIIEYDGTFQSFSIVNLHGQTIMQIPFKSDRKIEINIGDLEPGLYICSLVKMEGKTSMKRLIIL